MTAAQKFMFDMTFDGTLPDSGLVPAQPGPVDIADAELTEDKEAATPETGENREEEEEQQPGYSEEQLEAAKKEAYEKGKQEGVEAATETVEQQTLVALRTIGQHLTELFGHQETANNTLMKDSVGVAAAIVKKLFPAMDERHGEDEICRLIEHTLLRLIEEPRVVVKINPELTESLGRRLDGLKADAGYEGRLVLKEEASMNAGDCRLEWGDGSAERNVHALWQSIDEIIENNIGKIVPGTRENTDSGVAPDAALDNSEPLPESQEAAGAKGTRTESSDAVEDIEQEPAQVTIREPEEKPRESEDSEPVNPEAVREADKADIVEDVTETAVREESQADGDEPPYAV